MKVLTLMVCSQAGCNKEISSHYMTRNDSYKNIQCNCIHHETDSLMVIIHQVKRNLTWKDVSMNLFSCMTKFVLPHVIPKQARDQKKVEMHNYSNYCCQKLKSLFEMIFRKADGITIKNKHFLFVLYHSIFADFLTSL